MESAAVTVRIAATVSRGDLTERTALTERDVARQGTTPVISSVTSADLTEKVALTTTRDAHSEKVAHAEKDALTERVVLTEKTVVRQAKEDRHADLVRIHVRDSNPAVRAAHLATERGRKLQARDRRDLARAVSTRTPTKESRE